MLKLSWRSLPVLLVAVVSLGAKAKVKIDFGLEHADNYHGLPSEFVSGLNVENIEDDLLITKFGASYSSKAKKWGGLRVKTESKLNLSYLFDTETEGEEFSFVNENSVDEKVLSASIIQNILFIKKVSKKMAIYSQLSFGVHDGYTIDYHFFDDDYYLIRNKRFTYKAELGVQTKLSKKLRLNARYAVNLADYKYNYSPYINNDGLSNDNLNHFINPILDIKLSKLHKLSIDTKVSETRYKEKLALTLEGFEVLSGLAEQEKLLDYNLNLKHTYKVKKLFSLTSGLGFSKRDDKIAGARDNNAYKLSLNLDYTLAKGSSFQADLSYEDKKFDNRIAPFNFSPFPIIPNPEKLESQTQNAKLTYKRKIDEYDVKLYGSYKSVDSNRIYDRIKDNRYGLELSRSF